MLGPRHIHNKNNVQTEMTKQKHPNRNVQEMTGNVTLKESDKSSRNQMSWLKLKFKAVLMNVEVANARKISAQPVDSANTFV